MDGSEAALHLVIRGGIPKSLSTFASRFSGPLCMGVGIALQMYGGALAALQSCKVCGGQASLHTYMVWWGAVTLHSCMEAGWGTWLLCTLALRGGHHFTSLHPGEGGSFAAFHF